MSDPAQLVLMNQFGETSINYMEGSVLPLAPLSNIVLLAGTTAPTNGGSGTGNGVADTGSLYIAKDTGLLYANTNTKASPTWTIFEAGNASVIAAVLTGFSAGAGTVLSSDTILQAFNKIVGNTQNLSVIANVLTAFSAGAGTVSSSDTILGALQKLTGNTQNLTVLANVLTGFSAGAGTVTSSDTVLSGLQKLQGNDAQLKNGTFTPTSETISGAGALSTTVMESLVNNATGGTYAVTLAAPSSQDGQLKIITLGTAAHTVTLAMTNIKGPGFCTLSGTTTLTMTSTGDCAILMAVGAKWQLIGGNAVAS